MRILHLLTSLDPRHGGTVSAARQLSNEMNRQGVTTAAAVIDLIEPGWKDGWQAPVHSIGGGHTYYRFAPALVSWLRREAVSYDAVLVHGTWRYPSLAAWTALRGGRVPYFLYLHGMLAPWYQRTYPGKHIKKTVFWKLWEHRVLRDAAAVLFTNEEERRLARVSFQPFVCREAVVPLGVSAPSVDPAVAIAAFQAKFPELCGQPYLLFLSRLHRVKGCDVLIEAFAAVAREHPGLRLVMAGPDEQGLLGGLQERARALRIAHQVIWTGHIESPEKWGAFYGAEAFVLPSHTENFGVAVAEALSCGVPVLISTCVNVWREIDGCGAGLVEADTTAGATRMLRRWLALSAEEKRAFKQRARPCFEQHFEIKTATQGLLRFLRESTAAPCRRAS